MALYARRGEFRIVVPSRVSAGLELNRAGQVMVGPHLMAKGEPRIFALGDCASLVPEGAGRALPSTAQVANQQAMHLIRHLPNWLCSGKPMPPFSFRDFGALVALSDYNAFGTLGRFGFFKGSFIKGRFAQMSHAVLYRRHQLLLHGPRAARCCGWPNEPTRSCSPPSASVEERSREGQTVRRSGLSMARTRLSWPADAWT